MISKTHLQHAATRVLGQSVLIFAATLCTATAGAQIKVAFLAPDPPGQNPFWTRTVSAMQAAADDLQVDLSVVHSKSNTYSIRKDGVALMSGDRPDYFLTGYWPGATGHLLETAEELGVKTFVFNSGVPEDERARAGVPRGKYASWLGQLTPDDERAGRALADTLLNRARPRSTGEALHVLGLGGRGNTESEKDRRRGLEARISEQPGATLERFVYAAWSRDTAYQSLLEVLQPGTAVSVIWCNGDSMALGAVDAARQLNRVPGKDLLIGGIGWEKRAIESVAAGDIEAVIGGHFLEGAWALVLLYDYHHGHDFAGDLGVAFHSRLQAITTDNAQRILDRAEGADFSAIDFTRLSKRHNQELEQYQWPLDEVLKQLTGGGVDG